MKVILFVMAAASAAAVVRAEQLPLAQPQGYSIRQPAVPFTAEEVLPQPSQQYLNPDFSAAASAPTVPAQIYQAAAAPPAQQYLQPAAAPAPSYAAPQYQAPAQYDFAYAVDAYDVAGNKVDFGHSEQRNGAQTTGSYFILLPDTRRMRVEYYVDENGFHPTYTYEGEAVYPQAQAAAPVQQPSQLYARPGRK